MQTLDKRNVNIYGAYKLIAIPCLLSLLLGCTHPSETFDCKFEKGVGCRSITEVNHMVNRGEIKGIQEENHTYKSPSPATSLLGKDLSSNTMIERVNEQRLRVWLAPFQDEQGNFHEAAIVHTILKPGHWEWREKA